MVSYLSWEMIEEFLSPIFTARQLQLSALPRTKSYPLGIDIAWEWNPFSQNWGYSHDSFVTHTGQGYYPVWKNI